MRKTILTLAACLMSIMASAYTISTPITWSEDFFEMSKQNDNPTDGWITYGNGAAVSDIEKPYFPSADSPSYFLMDYGSKAIAFATTDFLGNAPADQWLISPEIEVPYDDMTLAFLMCTYNAGGVLGSPNIEYDQSGNPVSVTYTNPFKVLISDGSVEKDDFVELYSGSVKSKSSEEITTNERIINVNGYKGKKVRFAFVVTGQNMGFAGFTSIRFGQYTFYVVDDLNAELAEVGKPITIDFNTRIKAPVATPYLKTKLYFNDELVDEHEYKKAFGSATSYVAALQRIKLSNVYTPQNDTPLKYRLELTPDFEGAIPTIIEGGFGFPKITYLNNVVCEEMTGTKCQFCTRGLAALDYYHETYKGSETQGKVINIGIHSSATGADPMNNGVQRYLSSLAELNGAAGLPGAVFNRSTQGKDPTNALEVERQLALSSNNHAKITKVEMPEGETLDVIGQKMIVTVDVKNGYDSQLSNLGLAIVLLENNVQGKSSAYNQSNYYSVAPSGKDIYESLISAGAVVGMTPYFNQYSAIGEFNTSTIPYNKITYQHVARSITPSFNGQTLNSTWEADVPQTYTIEVEIPETIMNVENLEVAALVFNNAKRGVIVASDNMGASEFSPLSGVGSVNDEASSIKAFNEGGQLKVMAPAGSKTEIYSLDGRLLGCYVVGDGCLNAEVPVSGAVLVKVTSKDEVKTFKLMF